VQDFEGVQDLVKLATAIRVKAGVISDNFRKFTIEEIKAWFLGEQTNLKEFQCAANFEWSSFRDFLNELHKRVRCLVYFGQTLQHLAQTWQLLTRLIAHQIFRSLE